MIYSDFKDLKLSGLGFGTMRLPLTEDGSAIDRGAVQAMVDYAIDHGINYFDTAAPYHGGQSEIVIGEALEKHPREKWHLATKYPGHQHMAEFKPAQTFERQLEKCRTDSFDFYLFHNICENCLEDYMNPKWGILRYFVEQREKGRIKHLGMSSHASAANLKAILDGPYGKEIEFCQIQLNYLDWTLQDARSKVKLLNERHIPIWVMEPVRGGKLANAQGVPASYAFRWLQGIEGITMVLSGMSNLDQMKDNVATFSERNPLNDSEMVAVEKAAAALHNVIPCTGCRYCCDGCPMELNIPSLIAAYNDLSLEFSFTPMMQLEKLPEDKRPSACLGCGACSQICPQGIKVPEIMTKLSDLYDRSPKWSEICEARNKIG